MSTINQYTIAHALKKARENANLKQDTAARLLHIARPTLSSYENGNIENVTIGMLLQMSSVYGCPAGTFFTER